MNHNDDLKKVRVPLTLTSNTWLTTTIGSSLGLAVSKMLVVDAHWNMLLALIVACSAYTAPYPVILFMAFRDVSVFQRRKTYLIIFVLSFMLSLVLEVAFQLLIN